MFESLRRAPDVKINDMFRAALPRDDGYHVLEDAIYSSVLAARHAADRTLGSPLRIVDGVLQTNHEVDYGEWLGLLDERGPVFDKARLGVHVGFLVAQQLLAEEAPETVLALNMDCGSEW